MKNNTAQKNIPSGWQEKNLDAVCNIINGSTPKRSVSEYWENGTIPWFTVDDIRRDGRIIFQTNQSITEKALEETSVKLLPENSVLLCCTASLGEVAFAKIPLTTNQQFNGLVSKDEKTLFPYYLFYSAQKLGDNLKNKSGKTTINFLSVGTLSKEKVLIPPINEQQKIAEILGGVDEDIAKTQEVIEATEKLKRGLMQQLFTRGIGHTKFKETKIGQIPEEWEVKQFSKLFAEPVKNGLNRPTKIRGEGTKMVNMGELFAYPKITDQDMELVPLSDKESDFLLENGDLLFARQSLVREGAGKCSIYLGGNHLVTYEGHIIRCRLNKRIIFPEFYFYLFRSNFGWKIMTTLITHTAAAGIRGSELGNVDMVLPKIKEQKEIAKILSAVDEKISVNKKLKEKLTLLKKGLMQDLLSGKVRII